MTKIAAASRSGRYSIVLHKSLSKDDTFSLIKMGYVVFKYENNYYKCEYYEGSYGSGYSLDEYSLEQVFPKTKEVTYYE